MWIYEQGGAYKQYDSLSKYGNYTLGNLGYETNQCAFAPLIMDQIVLECPYGIIWKLYNKLTPDEIDYNIENDHQRYIQGIGINAYNLESNGLRGYGNRGSCVVDRHG